MTDSDVLERLRADNADYAEAVDHIMRVASAGRTQTRRDRWIALRAKSVLEGTEEWREVDMPSMDGAGKELERLRRKCRELHKENESLQSEITRLRASPWVAVQKLVPGEGVVEVDDPQYPAAGVDVLVEVTSASGTKYVVHRISTYPRNWSWPSFGLRWTPIPPLDQEVV